MIIVKPQPQTSPVWDETSKSFRESRAWGVYFNDGAHDDLIEEFSSKQAAEHYVSSAALIPIQDIWPGAITHQGRVSHIHQTFLNRDRVFTVYFEHGTIATLLEYETMEVF